MEFLEIPLFDDDFFKMLFRFTTNLIFLTIIIRFQYYRITKRHDYLFTYFLIGTIIFFLCFTLKKFELDMGVALGLFAIFGIIRYRTNTIAIKEMTYLFIVIGISVINALANKKLSYAEILAINVLTICIIEVLESFRELKKEISKSIVYEKIENVKPENYQILKQDLEMRTGLSINKIKVNDINFLTDTVKLTIYFYNEKAHDNL